MKTAKAWAEQASIDMSEAEWQEFVTAIQRDAVEAALRYVVDCVDGAPWTVDRVRRIKPEDVMPKGE